MQKQEPKIIAGDLSNEELNEWMEGKVNAGRQLKTALAERESLKQALGEVEKRILVLTSSAALELSGIEQDPTHHL